MTTNASKMARGLAAQRVRAEHRCEVCGATFVGLARARYCSRPCQQRGYRLSHAEQERARQREKNRRARERRRQTVGERAPARD